MASTEFKVSYVTGKTLKAVFVSSAHTVRYSVTPALEAWNDAHVASYGVAMTEISTTGIYYCTIPSDLVADFYSVYVVSCASGSMAMTDFPAVGFCEVDWTGVAQTSLVNAKMPEAYPTFHGTGSAAEMLYAILQHNEESANVGTTKTVNKRDGTTAAATYTYNSSTNPTAVTRAT